jgi:hypothetical protein
MREVIKLPFKNAFELISHILNKIKYWFLKYYKKIVLIYHGSRGAALGLSLTQIIYCKFRIYKAFLQYVFFDAWSSLTPKFILIRLILNLIR